MAKDQGCGEPELCSLSLSKASPSAVGVLLPARGPAVLRWARHGCRMSRLLETWCLMEYAEKGSLADALRTGRLKRPGGFPELGVIIACLQDIASGEGLVTLASWPTTGAGPQRCAMNKLCRTC